MKSRSSVVGRFWLARGGRRRSFVDDRRPTTVDRHRDSKSD